MLKEILDLRFAFLSTVMAAGEEDDEEDEDEDDEEDEEQPGSDKDKAEKDPRIKAANDEAKKHRLRAKEAFRQVRELKKAKEEAEEKEKPEIERLKGEVARQKTALEGYDELKIQNHVLRKAIELKVTTDVDFFEWKLRKAGHLKLDEEGDLPEEFEDAAKKLAQEMSASEKDGDESGDRSTDGEKPPPPQSPRLSNKKKGDKQSSDLQALTNRFPALKQRSGTPNL